MADRWDRHPQRLLNARAGVLDVVLLGNDARQLPLELGDVRLGEHVQQGRFLGGRATVGRTKVHNPDRRDDSGMTHESESTIVLPAELRVKLESPDREVG